MLLLAAFVLLMLPGRTRADVMTDADSDCVYVPESDAECLPLLLILSCVGATAQDIDSNLVVADSLGMILATCHGARNHRTGSENDADILNTMRKLVKDYPVDRERIYICGFSGMGVQALSEVVEHPEVFRGAVAACAPWRVFTEPEANALRGRACCLITRESDWNREGNELWQRWFVERGASVKLTVTAGGHEPGGPDELLEGVSWLRAQTD